MGSAGGQILLGYIKKIDNVGRSGYVNNVTLSALLNDGGQQESYGIMYYASTGATWADDNVISARAVAVAGTQSVPIKRRIAANSAKTDSNDGIVYIYAELTDITITGDVELRFAIETWGRYVEFVKA